LDDPWTEPEHLSLVGAALPAYQGEEARADTTKLMEMIAAFPNLTTLTAFEKQLTQPHPHPQRSFFAQKMHVGMDVKQETAAQTSGSESDGQTYSYEGQAVLKSFKVSCRANLFPRWQAWSTQLTTHMQSAVGQDIF
jgi:hypothetical protein